MSSKQPDVYSYIRFSSAAQAGGDSLRRQEEAVQQYCGQRGWILNPRRFSDLGVSAFDRSNANSGQLGSFLDAVKSGEVKPGSVLLIEAFDRLSRGELTFSVPLLMSITASEIEIITIADQKSWTKTNLNDLGVLMTSIVQMSRAHEESKRKSDFIRLSWAAKRQKINDGEKMTKECPSWLTLNEDRRSYSINEERVESIKKVYSLALEGVGVAAITSRANRENWPLPGSAKIWHLSRTKRLLSERKVLGEYQPHLKEKKSRIPVGEPIRNYYPAIIDENDWLRVQSIIDRRAKIPRRTSATRFNFLSGLLKCSCGASVTPKNIGRGLYRYYCMRKRLGQSDCLTITSEDVESAVISCLKLFDPLPHSEQRKIDSNKIEALSQKLVELKKKLHRIEDFIENSDSDVADLRIRYSNLKREQAETKAEILSIKEKLAESDLPIGSLRYDLLSKLSSGSNEDRQRLHTELLRAVKMISLKVEKFNFQLNVEYQDGHIADSFNERTIKTKDREDISKARTLNISESFSIDELIEFHSTKSNTSNES